MKRIILLLMTVMLCVSLCSCDTLLKKAKSAVTGEEESEMPKDYIATLENDEFTYELYDSYVKITKYIGVGDEEHEVLIPSEIDGKPVTTIGSLCFYDTEAAVVAVTIPDTVTTIEESAFYYADKIASITIPDSVTSIGSRAFAWCNSLETIEIGSGITEIPEYCFNHCEAITVFTLHSNITKIGIRAFSYCGKLTEIVIPENVTELGERAFDGCVALEYITFENESIALGNNIFENCENAVIIASDDSNAKNYCTEYGLRWSTSKDIEAVVLGGEESSAEVSGNGENSEIE